MHTDDINGYAHGDTILLCQVGTGDEVRFAKSDIPAMLEWLSRVDLEG